MEKLTIGKEQKIYKLGGELEMAYVDQEEHDAKYAPVDVVIIGDAKQIELMLNRLNAGYDGGVFEEELAPPTGEPKRPQRELRKGDVVEWAKPDGTRGEGKFHHEDQSGRGYVSLIDADGAVYVPMGELHYVDVESEPIPPKVVEDILEVLNRAYKDGYTAVADSAIRENVYSPSDITFWCALQHLGDTGQIERIPNVLKGVTGYRIVQPKEPAVDVSKFRSGEYVEWKHYDARHNAYLKQSGHYRGLADDEGNILVMANADGRIMQIPIADLVEVG